MQVRRSLLWSSRSSDEENNFSTEGVEKERNEIKEHIGKRRFEKLIIEAGLCCPKNQRKILRHGVFHAKGLFSFLRFCKSRTVAVPR